MKDKDYFELAKLLGDNCTYGQIINILKEKFVPIEDYNKVYKNNEDNIKHKNEIIERLKKEIDEDPKRINLQNMYDTIIKVLQKRLERQLKDINNKLKNIGDLYNTILILKNEIQEKNQKIFDLEMQLSNNKKVD